MFRPESLNNVLLGAALDPRFRQLQFSSPDKAFKVRSTVQANALDVKKEARQNNASENGPPRRSTTQVSNTSDECIIIYRNILGSSDLSTSEKDDEEQQ